MTYKSPVCDVREILYLFLEWYGEDAMTEWFNDALLDFNEDLNYFCRKEGVVCE